jgi:hypothetical protein
MDPHDERQMSRIFTSDDLLTWEAFASGGAFGMPTEPKIIFNCISRPGSRGRYVVHSGNEAEAEAAVHGATPEQMRSLLKRARELD